MLVEWVATQFEHSKYYLKENTTFIEVGTWRGGVCGLISLVNEDKNFDLYACDSFDGVKKSSEHDSFFKDGEYSDTGISYIRKVEELLIHKINVVEGTFPESMVNEIQNPISFAHIDVDTYFSAKESFEYISNRLIKGGVVVLDDYGGWFTDGVTRYGNELKNNTNYFVVPNHIGQLIIFKKWLTLQEFNNKSLNLNNLKNMILTVRFCLWPSMAIKLYPIIFKNKKTKK